MFVCLLKAAHIRSTTAIFASLFLLSASLRTLSGSQSKTQMDGDTLVSWLVHPGANSFDPLGASTFGSAAPMPHAGTEVSPRQMRALLRSRLPSAGAGFGSMSPWSFGGAAASSAPTSVLQLRILYGSEYIGRIGVGTLPGGGAAAYLNVIYDTGSADLWVASDLCVLPPCAEAGRNLFNHSRSTTFRGPASPVKLQTMYGSGELHGQLGFDDVHVGKLSARHQSLGLITEEIGQTFKDLPFDGVVGLAFSSLASGGAATLFDGLLRDSDLPRREFAFYLHPDTQRGGALLWGGTDSRLRNGETMQFPVLDELYWALDIIEFRVGNDTLMPAGGHLRGRRRDSSSWPRLIVDSGTTFFTADEQTWRAVAAAAPPTACDSLGGLPSLVYTIRDVSNELRDVVVRPEEYMVRNQFFQRTCSPGMVPMEMPPGSRPVMILGEVFMRHFFTVFSRGDAGQGSHVDFTHVSVGGEVDDFFAELASREFEASL